MSEDQDHSIYVWLPFLWQHASWSTSSKMEKAQMRFNQKLPTDNKVCAHEFSMYSENMFCAYLCQTTSFLSFTFPLNLGYAYTLWEKDAMPIWMWLSSLVIQLNHAFSSYLPHSTYTLPSWDPVFSSSSSFIPFFSALNAKVLPSVVISTQRPRTLDQLHKRHSGNVFQLKLMGSHDSVPTDQPKADSHSALIVEFSEKAERKLSDTLITDNAGTKETWNWGNDIRKQ